MKFHKKNNLYFGRLEKGEEIISSLIKFCKENKISNGKISAIGAAENLKLGFYDTIQKKYEYNLFEGDYEITSMLGNITLLNGEPFPHIHINISDVNFLTYGGHLFSAIVSITCEFTIEDFATSFERKPDEMTGLNLIDF